MAAEGRPSPVRRGAPVFGSVSVTNCWAATVVGLDQVAPPSEEETKPTLTPRGVNLGEPGRAAECVRAQGRIRAVARGLGPVPHDVGRASGGWICGDGLLVVEEV